VLGVEHDASKADRDAAYKALAKVLHPDKHAKAPDAFKQRLDQAMQLVNNARDAADLGGGGAAQAGGQGAAAAAQAATQREERRRAAEARRQEKQARDREAAAAASARATAFQRAASTGFSAPARASRGTTPWTRPGLGGALSR
jgi:curved DNA-binding protein CbpA